MTDSTPSPSVPPTLNPDDAFGLVRSYTRHVAFVRLAVHHVADDLQRRALVHDTSKMLDDEFAGFSRINAAARINKFGSPEYAEGMQREKPTIDLHFSRNRHHAEQTAKLTEAALVNGGIAHDMTFLDIIEMVCDWWGAQRGYDDNKRTWAANVALNLQHKGPMLTEHQRWLVQSVAAHLETLRPDYGR